MVGILLISMDPVTILDQLESNTALIIPGLLGLVMVLILIANRKNLLHRFREWRIQRCLKQIGCEQIRFLVCPDGLDNYYTIDRLALVQDAILLIAYKPYGGNIYCAERIAEWTQVIGRKSFKFENPLFELENQLISLKALAKDTPLLGYLFFDHSAVFPKGHPQVVLSPNTIPDQYLGVNCGPVKPHIQATWDLFKAQQKSPV